LAGVSSSSSPYAGSAAAPWFRLLT
jgi:hypothetical protein